MIQSTEGTVSRDEQPTDQGVCRGGYGQGRALAQAITTNGLSSFHTDGYKGIEQGETRRLWFMVRAFW